MKKHTTEEAFNIMVRFLERDGKRVGGSNYWSYYHLFATISRRLGCGIWSFNRYIFEQTGVSGVRVVRLFSV